jgi:N-acetylmuramoyl-L-alanine amidase
MAAQQTPGLARSPCASRRARGIAWSAARALACGAMLLLSPLLAEAKPEPPNPGPTPTTSSSRTRDTRALRTASGASRAKSKRDTPTPPSAASKPQPAGRTQRAPAAAPTATEPRGEPEWLRIAPPELPENAVVETEDGETWIGAHDLARLLVAAKFWRSDVRKLELRAQGHRVQLTVDNPFVLVDDHTVTLPAPVRSRGGQLRVPVAIVDSLPRDTSWVRLAYDPVRRRVLRVPRLGLVHRPKIASMAELERISFPADRPSEVTVIGRSRAHFRIRFGGLFVGSLPDTLPPGGLVRSLRAITSASGSSFEIAIGPEAGGYRLEIQESRGMATLLISRASTPDFDAFAPEGPPGPRAVRVIVLDPGHGGGDPGVIVSGAIEKNLTLSLARELARALGKRLRARVILTRTDDRSMTVQERAERANRAHADLVISLHFDGGPASAARGVCAYCAPATFGGASGDEGLLLPWRDVATRHAVRSRELAEAVLSAFELRGLGPARLREILPYTLLGVNAPGLMLECATLTSDADRARVLSASGISTLAGAIAAGIDAYTRQ